MPLNFSSLSGSNSFSILASTGGAKTATLDKSYPAGTYLIESKANDANLELYLGALDGSQVGFSGAGAKTITASSSFIYVTTVNADANDLITFTLKSTSTLATKTDAVWAPPTITDITPSGLPNTNSTTTITGTNFATNVDVKFRKSDDATLVSPKSTVRGSSTSIIATRPDAFSPSDAPYDVIITNPSTNLSVTSLNSITAGAVPVWVTSTTLNTVVPGSVFSQTIQATDADGGSSITYAIVSGSLPTGLSLNTSTGVISGTTSVNGSFSVTISATDSGLNSVNRTFTGTVENPVLSVQYLIIGGGGSGDKAGGGGAGGVLLGTADFALSTPHTLKIGAGGSGGFNTSTKGTDSQFSSLIAYAGGVGSSTQSLKNGGSGAGAHNGGTPGTPVSGQGHGGGIGPSYGSNGGGGGAGAAGSTNNGGAGVYSSITGTNVIYAGGGGGGQGDQNGGGGPGGGGGGGHGGGWGYSSWPGPTSGSQYGAGGGGQGYAQDNGYTGGNGYQGFVVLKYPDTRTMTSSGITSTTTTSGGFKITQITAGNGTVTFV